MDKHPSATAVQTRPLPVPVADPYEKLTQNPLSDKHDDSGRPAATEPSLLLADSALICGVIGLVGALVPLVQYVTLLPAIAGIGLGIRGGRQALVSRTDWSAAAVGCVLCAISVVLTVLDILYSG